MVLGFQTDIVEKTKVRSKNIKVFCFVSIITFENQMTNECDTN
jgi:hypothetical protein